MAGKAPSRNGEVEAPARPGGPSDSPPAQTEPEGPLVAAGAASAGALVVALFYGAPVLGDQPPALELAGLFGLFVAALLGGLLPHLDRYPSVACRLMGRRGRELGETLQCFGYREGPTHSPLPALAAAAAAGPVLAYAYGFYGFLLVVCVVLGYVSHLLADLLLFGRPIGLVWPLGPPESRFSRVILAGPGRRSAVSGQGLSALARILPGDPRLAGALIAGGALAALAARTAPVMDEVEPGVAARTAEAIPAFVMEALVASRPELYVAAGSLAVVLGCVATLPRLATAAARKASERGNYGGLEGFRLRAGAEADLTEARAARVLDSILKEHLPKLWGEVLFLGVEVGEEVAPVVTGRGLGPLKRALESEYAAEGCVVESLDAAECLALVPAGGEADGLYPVTVEFAATGENRLLGSLSTDDLGGTLGTKDALLGGPLRAARSALDVASGERGMLQVEVRKPNAASVAELKERLDELDQQAQPQARVTRRGVSLKKRLAFFWLPSWIKDQYLLNRSTTEEGPRISDDDKEERKALQKRQRDLLFAVRASAYAYLLRDPASGAGGDPEKFVGAARQWADSFSRGGGQELSVSRISTGSAASRAAVRMALRLPGTRPTRDTRLDLATSKELAMMWHPLGRRVRVDGRAVAALVTKAPYAGMPREGLFVGWANHEGYGDYALLLRLEDLDTHGVLTGRTGKGKSSYYLALIQAVIGYPYTGPAGAAAKSAVAEKMGLVLLDPKGGELFSEVISILPSWRLEDAIVVDLGEHRYAPPRLNVFDPFPFMNTRNQATTVVRGMESRFPNGFGDNMRPIFVNAAEACIAANKKRKERGEEPIYGLTDLTAAGFLVPRIEDGEGGYEQPRVRRQVLAELRGDPEWEQLVEYWDNKDSSQSAAQQGKEWNPITNKIDSLQSDEIKAFLGGGRSTIDLMDVLVGGRIVLFNLSQGSLPGDTYKMIGTIFLNLFFRVAAIRHDLAIRSWQKKDLRRMVCVVDEVQNFVCPEMEKILTEGRSWRCSLWSANQFLSQIREEAPSLAEAFANAGTHALFGTTNRDARTVADFINDDRFVPDVMANMPKYNFVMQRDGEVVTGRTVEMPDPDPVKEERIRVFSAAGFGASAGSAATLTAAPPPPSSAPPVPEPQAQDEAGPEDRRNPGRAPGRYRDRHTERTTSSELSGRINDRYGEGGRSGASDADDGSLEVNSPRAQPDAPHRGPADPPAVGNGHPARSPQTNEAETPDGADEEMPA